MRRNAADSTSYVETVELASRDPERALAQLARKRNREWTNGNAADAHDIALMSISVARATGHYVKAFRSCRWLAKRFPEADSFLLLGDAAHRVANAAVAREAWERAASLARREGRLGTARVAESRLRRGVVEDGEDIIDVARRTARQNPAAAIAMLRGARRRLMRQGGWRDAAELLVASAHILRFCGETRKARYALSRAIRENPLPSTLRFAATLELEVGENGHAIQLAREAMRRARRIGSLTERTRAAEILERASVESTSAVAAITTA